jgi:hypothetical protein
MIKLNLAIHSDENKGRLEKKRGINKGKTMFTGPKINESVKF